MSADDGRVTVASDLKPETLRRLMTRVRRRFSTQRARSLALAAVRETFEETGLIVGELFHVPGPAVGGWSTFFATGHAPALAGLQYFARAITPPGGNRRFDTRFFVADAHCVANLDRPLPTGTEELLSPSWFTFAEARRLDLATITLDILDPLAAAYAGGGGPDPTDVCFQFMRGGKWQREQL